MPVKLSFFFFMWSSIIIFCLVPIFVNYFDFGYIIYSNYEVSLSDVFFNAIVICLPICAGYFLINKSSFNIQFGHETPYIAGISIFCILWAVLFYFGGAEDYRLSDFEQGFRSRSFLIKLVFFVQNSVNILLIYLFVAARTSTSENRYLYYIPIFIVLAITTLSDSRGIVLQYLVAAAVAISLKNQGRGQKIQRPKLSQSLKNISFFSKMVFFSGFGLMIFSIWGILRDQQENSLRSILHRLAEPYWKLASVSWEHYGSDWSLVSDALYRIASIPFRWFGVSFEGTVDGSDFFLNKYLNIPYQEGVSLPITLLGHGILAGGYWGALLFFVFATFLMVASFYMIKKFPTKNNNLTLALISYQISKCLFIYSKSLSGVFLYLIYESARDFIILMFILFFIKIMGRRIL